MSEVSSTPPPVNSPELVEKAKGLFPLIREGALDAEAARHLQDGPVSAYKEAGLVRTLQPKRWGGHEASFTTAFEVAMELGRADGSHGWCMTYWADHAYLLALFGEGAQADVWGEDEDAMIATSFAPAGEVEVVDGGYRLKGDWAWASGVTHSGWIIVGALIFGGEHPEFRLFLVPREDFSVEDVWHNAGLRATGSDTVSIDGAFVPAHRTMTMDLMREAKSPGAETNTSPLYRVPLIAAYEYALLGPAIGAARGAVDAWIEWTKPKMHSYTGEQVAANAPQQIRLASVEGKIDSAELMVRRALATIEDWHPLDIDDRVRNRLDFTFAMRTVVAAMDELIQVGGASGLFDSSPLQRAWRDVHAISMHVSMNFEAAAENYGRRRLGIDLNPRDPFF
jgi:3-hydroxy-9,10-secoandrosta-1,3,5(10)-triene-9,17-dione monooxygenase